MASSNYRTRLIFVDGITGSGKSTTAQFICQQLEVSGIKAKWYHEEEPGHPLESRFDVEHQQDAVEIEGFYEETQELWRRFAEMAQSDDRVHIIESYLLQDTARVLFRNNVHRGRITQLIEQILQSVMPLNPVLVYFWRQDAAASLRRIWERRGERWAQWCIETDACAPYSQTVAGSNEEKAIALWRDYQAYANQLVAGLTIPKLCIENTAGKWQEYQRQIVEFLGLTLQVLKGSGFSTWGSAFVKYQLVMGIGDALPAIVLCLGIAALTLRDPKSNVPVRKLPMRQALTVIAVIAVIIFVERTIGYQSGLISSEYATYPIETSIWTGLFAILMGCLYVLLYPLLSTQKQRYSMPLGLAATVGVNWIIFNSFIGLILQGLMPQMLLRSGLDVAALLIASMVLDGYWLKGKLA